MPLRFVADSLGAQVSYDSKGSRVEVVSTVVGRTPGLEQRSGGTTQIVGGISAIDLNSAPESITVTRGQSERTIAITSDAKIVIQDVVTRTEAAAALTDLHVGDAVGILLRRDGRVDRVVARFASRAGTIAAVSASAFVLQSGYVVTPDKSHRVTLNGQPAAIGDLKVGDSVTVRLNPDTGEKRQIIVAREVPSTPGPAGTAQITDLAVAARGPLHAGDAFAVTLRGTPGGRATFDIGTYVSAQPMHETQPGVYSATYTVPPGVNFGRTTVYGHLNVGGAEAPRAEASQLVSVDHAAPDRRHRARQRPHRQQQQALDLRHVPLADRRRDQPLQRADRGQRPRRHRRGDAHRLVHHLQPERAAGRRQRDGGRHRRRQRRHHRHPPLLVHRPLALTRIAEGACHEDFRLEPTFAALALALAASACGGGSGGGSGAGGGGGAPLVMARVKDAVVLDPSHATDGLSLNTSNEVMQNLVQFKPGSFDIVGDAAQKWSASADGKTWTFDLQPGLVFSDGTPLDAKAVKFNLDRWRLPSNPAHGNFSYSYYADDFGGFPGVITDVQAPTATRVVIKLAKPLGPFLRDIAEQPFGLGSPQAIIADPKAFELKPVGSGPYTLTEWVRDDHITLTANPKFAGPKPGYGTVIIRDIPDQATSVLSIQHGDIDILTDPRPDDAKSLASQKGITIAEQPSNNVSYVAMDVEKKPFGDLRVRQAVAYALDEATMAQRPVLQRRRGRRQLDPARHARREPGGQSLPARRRARRKSLLAAAGLSRTASAPTLYYPTAPRPYMPEPQRVAETIQANLRDAGSRSRCSRTSWASSSTRSSTASTRCASSAGPATTATRQFLLPAARPGLGPQGRHRAELLVLARPEFPQADAGRPEHGRRRQAQADLPAGQRHGARPGAGDSAGPHHGPGGAQVLAQGLHPEPQHRVPLRDHRRPAPAGS